MKINWGTGITFFILAFISFILSMVIRATFVENDLESVNYYEQEVTYQTRINAIHNYKSLGDSIRISQNRTSLNIQLPNQFKNQSLKGSVKFVRPNNAQLDREFPLQQNKNTNLEISKKELNSGWYSLEVNWVRANKDFFFSQQIQISKK